MKNALILLIIFAVLSFSVGYIIKAKKEGKKCIGCPYSKDCNGKCNGKFE